MRHTLKWFINRIGKRIYRKPLSCKCASCQKSYVDIGDGTNSKGERISSREQHAEYLYLVQNEMGIDYSDKSNKR